MCNQLSMIDFYQRFVDCQAFLLCERFVIKGRALAGKDNWILVRHGVKPIVDFFYRVSFLYLIRWG